MAYYSVNRECHVVNSWPPACGIILGSVEPLRDGAWLVEGSHLEWPLKVIPIRPGHQPTLCTSCSDTT